MGEELLDSIASGLTQNFTQEGQVWVIHFITALSPHITRHKATLKQRSTICSGNLHTLLTL